MLEQLNLSENEKRCSNTSSCRWSRSAGWIAPPPSRICASPSSKGLQPDRRAPAREPWEHARSVKADRILTGKYMAIPMFVLIMLAVFYLTFNVIGSFLSDLLTPVSAR